MWYPIIMSLKKHLEELPEFDGILISAGAKVDIPSYPYIEILRDISDGALFHGVKHGEEQIFVQGWTRSDEPDPVDGYELQWELEQLITEGIRLWAKEIDPELQCAIKVTLVKNVSDGEQFKPICGNRFILKVSWKMVK